MTNRELFQQVLNEYLVFSDKTSDGFISSLEVPEQIEPVLVTYLNYSTRHSEEFGWHVINKYWTVKDLSHVSDQLRSSHE